LIICGSSRPARFTN